MARYNPALVLLLATTEKLSQRQTPLFILIQEEWNDIIFSSSFVPLFRR